MSDPRWTAIVNPELMLALVDIALNDEQVAARFWVKVDKRMRDDDRCWIWTAALSGEGYGGFKVIIDGRHHVVLAHRMAWFLTYPSPLEHWQYLDHLAPVCRGRYCVNPEHLEPISKVENDLRRTGATSAASQRVARSTHLAERDARALAEVLS